jgi:hypothetical protein
MGQSTCAEGAILGSKGASNASAQSRSTSHCDRAAHAPDCPRGTCAAGAQAWSGR